MNKRNNKRAVLWLTQDGVHVLKYERNWCGVIQNVLGSTFSDIKDAKWLEDEKKIYDIIREIIQIYGLADYSIELVLSGPQLVWKIVELEIGDTSDAYEAAGWMEPVVDKPDYYNYDVFPAGPRNKNGILPCVMGAYPRETVRSACQAAADAGTSVDFATPLPLMLSWQYGGVDGTIYVLEKNLLHILPVHNRLVSAYSVTVPSREDDAFTSDGDSLIVYFKEDGDSHISLPVWRKSHPRFCKKWNLAGPATLLIGRRV